MADPNERQLHCAYQEIQHWPDLNTYQQVVLADFTECNLADDHLSTLATLGKLQVLVVDGNRITSLNALPILPDLQTLSLNRNAINDVDEVLLYVLTQTPSLQCLSLLLNACCPSQLNGGTAEAYNTYRRHIVKMLPSLTNLDCQAVTTEDRTSTSTTAPATFAVSPDFERQAASTSPVLMSPLSPTPKNLRTLPSVSTQPDQPSEEPAACQPMAEASTASQETATDPNMQATTHSLKTNQGTDNEQPPSLSDNLIPSSVLRQPSTRADRDSAWITSQIDVGPELPDAEAGGHGHTEWPGQDVSDDDSDPYEHNDLDLNAVYDLEVIEHVPTNRVVSGLILPGAGQLSELDAYLDAVDKATQDTGYQEIDDSVDPNFHSRLSQLLAPGIEPADTPPPPPPSQGKHTKAPISTRAFSVYLSVHHEPLVSNSSVQDRVQAWFSLDDESKQTFVDEAISYTSEYNIAMSSLQTSHPEPLNPYMHFGLTIRAPLSRHVANPSGPRLAGVMVDIWNNLPKQGLAPYEQLAKQDIGQ
eukprot:m.68085 g.68085  ORF g.68085 m.68085 type:complete len:531 (-) comp14095_c0_seq6:83-1675(-)